MCIITLLQIKTTKHAQNIDRKVVSTWHKMEEAYESIVSFHFLTTT